MAAAQLKPTLKVYPLSQRFAQQDVQNLSTMVPGAEITLADDQRHLRVMALPDEHEQLDELIKQFEAAAAAQVEQQFHVYQLDFTLSTTDVSDLSTLVPDAKIIRSDDGRQLRVMALADDHKKIEGLLAEFETAAKLRDELFRIKEILREG